MYRRAEVPRPIIQHHRRLKWIRISGPILYQNQICTTISVHIRWEEAGERRVDGAGRIVAVDVTYVLASRRTEPALAVIQKHRCGIAILIGRNDVGMSIPIEIGHRQSERCLAAAVHLSGSEI